MIKVVFIKKKKRLFSLKVVWISSWHFLDYVRKIVFEETHVVGGLFFYGRIEDVFYPTCSHTNLIICLSLICWCHTIYIFSIAVKLFLMINNFHVRTNKNKIATS